MHRLVPLLTLALGCTPPPSPSTTGPGATGPTTAPVDPDPVLPTLVAPTGSDPVDTATPGVSEMYGFSFVDEHLAGMPRPYDDDVPWLVDQGITLLVGLRLDPFVSEPLDAAGIDYLHLPIEDFQPPTLEQQIAFVEAARARVAAGERVGVHCTAGLGRTGTMLATWFVAHGMAPRDAIDEVRALRPGSIETEAQEEAVVRFATATR